MISVSFYLMENIKMSDWVKNTSQEMPCEFGVAVEVEFRDGDTSSGFVEDFYWGIDGDIADIVMWRLKCSKTETPEEALDMIDTTSKQVDGLANDSELPNGSVWENGDECRYNDINWLFCGFHPTNGLAIVASNDEPSSHQVITVDVDLLLKPETTQQREERERREEAEEMIQCLLDNYVKCEESAINYVLEYLHECNYRKAK